MKMTFGNRLRRGMKAANLSPADLADFCGVRPETVRKWFRMVEARLEARHAACAALAMRVDLATFVLGSGYSLPKKKFSAKRGLIGLKK